ncbi:rubredoxin [uncultured Cetobacterium sp.]|uniref:rubredoxin n=1 Tax=uncultured Cetobacterium sp. TaxID=527638 RepID=UPI00262FDB21|nr:rubredoxin [uncultured Cetobacterium sp.]
MEKWICILCGHIYSHDEGDEIQDIDIGIKFEDLPRHWVCPLCGGNKDYFFKDELI